MGKKMLIVDTELMEMIDANRGDMSQGEFLKCLMESVLDSPQAAPAITVPDNGQYVKREDFDKFTQDMKELLKQFLDFFLTSNLNIKSGPQDGDFDKLVHQLQSLSLNGAKTRR